MKKGFTLIEMLIVLGIIGALSILSINGYMDYRRSAILDLSADNLISQIEQLKIRTRSGEISGLKFKEISDRIDEKETKEFVEDIKCYGFYFSKNEGDNYSVKGFSLPFLNVKTFDVISGEWKYLGCSEFSEKKDFDFAMETDVYFSSADIALENVVVNFAPPSGDILTSLDGGLKYGLSDFSFLIKYGENDFRTIFFNANTGKLNIQR